MPTIRQRQFLVERRILRSTIGQWLADRRKQPPTGWETLATFLRLKTARWFQTFAIAGESPQGLFVASAEYRIRRRDIPIEATKSTESK